MRSRIGQPKTRGEPDAPQSGTPQPQQLPGMGPLRHGGPRRAAQARSNDGISTTPVAAGRLRTIGEGQPLEPGIRQTMEGLFDADFSGVRVHEGPTAEAMGALAFTLGEQLHFAPGLYDPTTRHGVELLGHELTHVVQQRDGRVANPYGQGVAIVQDPALEAEADRMGQHVADQVWSRPTIGQPATAGGAARPTRALQAKPKTFAAMARQFMARALRRGGLGRRSAIAQRSALAVPKAYTGEDPIAELQAIAEAFRAFAKAEDTTIQEVQAMWFKLAAKDDLELAVSANNTSGEKRAVEAIAAGLKKATADTNKHARGAIGTAKTYLSTPAHATHDTATPVPGRSHAEQNLLRWIAPRLTKESVFYIAGTKDPCTQCLPRLSAYFERLKSAGYAKMFTYHDGGRHQRVEEKDVKDQVDPKALDLPG
ncbi:MAG: DUF4157 domain-containing protein [Deltaproteobacteria bacterium]|nr:DUF4157 domain-containing protein [Deltaproteobacteria bacterium]